jgi:hypothetical protein
MQSITFQTPRSKMAPTTIPTASKAYFATLYDTHGVLTQDSTGVIWFLASDTQELTMVTPEMCPFLMPHGEVGLAEAAALADARRGGYAKIATTRDMERR